MAIKSIKDAIKQLQSFFAPNTIPSSLSPECRRMLQDFVAARDGHFNEEDANRTSEELKDIWVSHIRDNPTKLGAFVGALKELQPALSLPGIVMEWYALALKPVLSSTKYSDSAVEEAQDFLVEAMLFESTDGENEGRYKTSARLRKDIMGIFVSRSRGRNDVDDFGAQDNARIVQQFEHVLLSFGRKQPKDLCLTISAVISQADSRLQALALLSSFLQSEAPRKYLIVETPLFDQLLTCLLNDTSTTILSIALTSLIMLLPHIPAMALPYLPRLYLIYSRLLCWEKYNPLSTDAERNLVIDSRFSMQDDDTEVFEDVGTDSSWEKATPVDGTPETASPDLLTFFTFLYGLYPLNFTCFIRKPKRYLKDANFPSAQDFDLDQSVIRARSDVYCRMHLLHPNFYNTTIADELTDSKWPNSDPADLAAECQSLFIETRPTPASPDIPPASKLSDTNQMSAMAAAMSKVDMGGRQSPAPSHSSLRSGVSWRDTQSNVVSASAAPAEVQSPPLKPLTSTTEVNETPDSMRPRSKSSLSSMRAVPHFDDLSSQQPANNATSSRGGLSAGEPPQSNLGFYQREIALLRNDLNFERWHKAQYSQHISQMMRANVKGATAEAETLNLINQNQSLKAQLDQARKAREATIKDSALTRKQANNLEANLVERFNKMRAEQETWAADADELKRLRGDITQYRELLVAREKREFEKNLELEIVKSELQELQATKDQLREAQQKIRELEIRDDGVGVSTEGA